jgi:hypothetical protein
MNEPFLVSRHFAGRLPLRDSLDDVSAPLFATRAAMRGAAVMRMSWPSALAAIRNSVVCEPPVTAVGPSSTDTIS